MTPNAAILIIGNEVLSAVLFIENRWHQGEVQYEMKVYHNPWATNPLALESFGIIPQLVPAPQPNGAAATAGPVLSWRNQMKQLVSLAES